MYRLSGFRDLQKMRTGAAALTALLIIFLMSGCTARKEFTSQQFLMDTVVDITAYSSSQETSRTAVLAAFDEIKRIAALTDRFPERGSNAFNNSDVCKINSRAGIEAVEVSEDVLEILELAEQYNELTSGAFDVTVGPLMDLWGFGTPRQTIPDETLLQQKLDLVGMDKVVIDREAKTVFLSKKGMSIDLGGISKGYAAEKAAAVLKEHGITQAVINAGGNVVVLGKKDKGTPWKLGIQDPRDSNNLIGVLSLTDQAAVTSGDYQRFFEREGIRYHHLLDPATGRPARELISVTVICDSSAEADILSTALFVMGVEKGMELVNNLEGVEALFISRDREIILSPGLKDKVRVTPGKDYTYDPKG